MDFSNMQHTEQFIKDHVAAGRAGDVAIAIGNREGECYRFFHSNRGDVQNGQTLYDMMSVTKLMATTPLCHIAIEEGKISPEDTLEKYFPYAPEDKKKITLLELLTHTGGLGHEYMPPMGPDKRREAIEFNLNMKLLFAPGTDFFYSCNGFILLAFILEQVYNKPFNLLFDDRIARPLGLKNTAFLLPVSKQDNIVECTAYFAKYEGANKCMDENARALYGVAGNAGIFSCLDDMSVFARSLLGGHSTLMKPETFETCMHTDYTPTLKEGRSLGGVYVDRRYLQTGHLFADGSVGHCGYSGTNVFADPAQGFYVVGLSNTTRYVKGRLAETILYRENLHNAIAEDLGMHIEK